MKKNDKEGINIKSFLEQRFELCQNKVYLCSPATFLTILLLEKKRLRRNCSKLFLIHFYFSSEKKYIMYKLKNNIQKILNENLRKSDVVTWVSYNHLIILFKNREIVEINHIKDRVKRKIKKSKQYKNIRCKTIVKEITNPMTNKYNKRYH